MPIDGIQSFNFKGKPNRYKNNTKRNIMMEINRLQKDYEQSGSVFYIIKLKIEKLTRRVLGGKKTRYY